MLARTLCFEDNINRMLRGTDLHNAGILKHFLSDFVFFDYEPLSSLKLLAVLVPLNSWLRFGFAADLLENNDRMFKVVMAFKLSSVIIKRENVVPHVRSSLFSMYDASRVTFLNI